MKEVETSEVRELLSDILSELKHIDATDLSTAEKKIKVIVERAVTILDARK